MTGFVSAVLGLGLGAVKLNPVKRGMFPSTGEAIIAQATVEEVHTDDLEITDHPIEQGAAITDHAFKRPAEVIVRCGFSNSPSVSGGLLGGAISAVAATSNSAVRTIIGLASTASAAQSLLSGNAPSQAVAIYGQLLAAQANRVLFDIYTGKRVYRNVLLKSLSTTTDRNTENALIISATFRQVILVKTRTVTVPINPDAQALPARTTPTSDMGQRQLGVETFAVIPPTGTVSTL